MSKTPPVKNRRALAVYLDECMNKAYRQLVTGRKLGLDTSLVKTYLIEAHALPDSSHDSVLSTLRGGFSSEYAKLSGVAAVHETDDEYFFDIDFRSEQDSLTLYVDATTPRFWLMHSMGRSTSLDYLIRTVVRSTHSLDSVWLPIQLLERVSSYGNLRGLGLHYDRREVPDVDFEAPDSPVEFLKMQVWGNRAGRVLEILREQGAFPDATTLSKVKLKYWLDPRRETAFSIDDIKFDGKITARGTSFQSHITLVSKLYEIYAGKVQETEKRFSISFRTEDGTRLSVNGAPVNIFFTRPIQNLAAFCKHLFSTNRPFRLWGVPITSGNGYVKVSAVDLHVGRRVNFEITPNFMRVYLGQQTCGNSLARLYTNLQHYYNSQVKALDENGEPVFNF